MIATVGGFLGSVGNTSAQERQRTLTAPTSLLASAKLSAIEDAFWVCDYVATTRGASEIAACTAVYEAIKDQKFAGDFDALVSWWRQNKTAQHQNIAAGDSSSH